MAVNVANERLPSEAEVEVADDSQTSDPTAPRDANPAQPADDALLLQFTLEVMGC